MPSSSPISRRRGLFYLACAGLIAAWTALLMVVAVLAIPDLYWFSYYSVDYDLGFVRRGLAGELAELFAEEHYFDGLRVLRWVPTLAYAAGLAVLVWAVAARAGRTERRVLTALLIPVLPFGVTFALFSARPDLVGATALIVLAVVVCDARHSRPVVVAAAGYGVVTAVLALAHEATPLLFGLGALCAIAVLGRTHSAATQRLSAALALGPGLVVTAVVAIFGRRGLSEQLCQSIPHGPVNWPASGKPTIGQILQGFRYEVDFHDWICRNLTPLYDQSFTDAVRFVADIGPVLLAASTAIGVALLVVTMLSISHVTGVPFARFAALLKARLTWLVFGLALIVPVFLTGVDWIRWWVTIGLDIGVVFLLFASREPESEIVPTRRTLVVFAAGLTLLALFPIGILPGFGAPVPT